MLPSQARVRRGADFAATIAHGRRARRGSVVVHLRRRETPRGTARAGFIVNKGVGTAVIRNKVKRRLRHIAAERLGDWPADIDVVVRALPQSCRADFSQLASDVDAAVAAIGRRRS